MIPLLNNFKKAIEKQSYLIKNYALISFTAGIGLYVYSLLISYYNPKAIEPTLGREIFSTLFILIAFIPFISEKITRRYYEYFFFGELFLFIHYLIYVCYLNSFTIDYLLGTYILIFGTLLMLNSRRLIILFSILEFLHILEKVLKSDLDIATTNAIITSIGTILLFSFFVLNGNLRQRKKLKDINLNLEKKVAERTQDLEKRANELLEKNKDLEDFAQVVSHDLRQPLKNIFTLSEWLVEENKGKANEKLNLIKTQVSQMYLLIEGVLDYSLQNKQYTKINTVDLNTLITELIELDTTENCTIVLEKKLPVVSFNKPQILQVFQNLIQNAIKYNDKENIEISITYEEQKEQYLFSITDNGPGISKKYHEKVFELFERLEVDKNDNSTGMGLALVKKILTRSKGTIWIESALQKGTTFFFTIPKNR